MIPATVLADVVGGPAELHDHACEPLSGSMGATTSSVTRITGHARRDGDVVPFSVIRKAFAPVTSGRHAAAATDPRHWAYWRREPLAYASGLLPAGQGLAAPRLHGMVGDVLFLADVAGQAEEPGVAAERLGAWQGSAPVTDLPWLAGHQLAQRLAVTELDWTTVDADPRLSVLWARRHELLASLDGVPRVLCHGDFHVGNLVATGDTTVVLDWGTLGVGPVGSDLALLALSTLDDLFDVYLSSLAGPFDRFRVLIGYRVTAALTGTSRVHWMLSRSLTVPDGYVDFVLEVAPR